MWIHRASVAIGGLENVGYAPNVDLLLVLSSQGQGVFDCMSGQRIARTGDESDWWENFDVSLGTVSGVGPLGKMRIPIHGLHSPDSLVKKTVDGWQLLSVESGAAPISFEASADRTVYLISPDGLFRKEVNSDGPCELRAFGFSDTGNSFVVASSCELVIYCRD